MGGVGCCVCVPCPTSSIARAASIALLEAAAAAAAATATADVSSPDIVGFGIAVVDAEATSGCAAGRLTPV